MSEQQTSRYGSTFSQMFGYVTPEDRSKWEQARAQNQPKVNALKVALQSAASAVMEFGQRNLDAELKAAHQMVAREDFEESNVKTVRTKVDKGTGTVTETVDYTPKGLGEAPRVQEDSDFDFG